MKSYPEEKTEKTAAEPKVLFTASTRSHIMNFHIPYLQWFCEQSWRVHVACGGAEIAIPYADQTIELPFEKRMSAPANFRAALQLRRLMKKERYTLLCVHTSLAAFFSRLALLGLKERPKVVNVVHGYLFDDETPWWKRTLLLTAERLMAPMTDLVLTMNQYDRAAAEQYRLGRKVAYIPGIGLNTDRLASAKTIDRTKMREKLGLAQEAFVILYAAEFSKRKSQSVLIRAMEYLPQHVILVLAGQGAELVSCREQAASLGDRVRFPGQIKDIGAWYTMADAVASSSRSEGLPFNIMEAMHLGRPVVASSVKGHVDLITHNETGLLYPYGDAQALAQQLRRLMDDSSLTHHLAAQAKVDDFCLKQVLPQVTAYYASLCSL